MTPDAILFDLDGTLIATKALYLEAYRLAVRPYVREELGHDEIKALSPTSELGFLRAVVHEDHLPACLEDFYAAYGRLHGELFEGIYDGVAGLLDDIRDAGVPLGVVTGKSRRSWEITSALAPLGRFDVLVFDDDVPAPKPDPRGLRLALDRVGARPERSLYIGDTVTDVRAAMAAGVRPIAALWARKPDERGKYAERARDAGAVVVDRPADLRPLLSLKVPG
jgi:phosphoglycolate phosphatase/pyrophosphatase PpaX